MRGASLKEILCLVFLGTGLLGMPAHSQEEASPPKVPVEPVMLAGPVKPRNVTPEERRIEKQKRHELKRKIFLERAMQREGPEFSQEKYENYRERTAVGAVLTVFGAAAAAGAVLWVALAIGGPTADDDESDPEGKEENPFLGERWQQGTCLTLLLSAVVTLPLGIPLVVSGHRGVKRQELLRSKEEILKPFGSLRQVSLGAFSSAGAGGIMLRANF